MSNVGMLSRPLVFESEGGAKGMKYKVVLNESQEGFSVSCPGLPGCWSQGATEEEALENVHDAITEYLSVVDRLMRGQEVREISVTN
jgi:predicted RNase H-like HicB family nuclease